MAINIYKDNPTEGGTDGTAVSTGGDFTAPISFTLDAGQKEVQTLKLAIRTGSGYVATNVTIKGASDTNNRLKLCITEEGTYADSITFDTVQDTNQIFYVKASSDISEAPQIDRSIRLSVVIWRGTLPEEMRTADIDLISYLPFTTSTTQDTCGNTWATTGSPSISNGTLKLNGSSYLQNNLIADEIGSDSWTIQWHATCTNKSKECTFLGTFNANVATNTTSLPWGGWVRVAFSGGTPGIDFCMESYSSNLSLKTGTEYHYALSYDGTTLRLFVGGNLAISINKDIKLGIKPDGCSYTIYGSEPRLTGRCTIDQYDFDMFKKRAITEKNFKKKLQKKFVTICVSGHRCFAKNLYIAYDLEVFPCVMERRFSHGSIKDKNFKLQQLYRDYCKDNIEGCKDCEFRYTCFDCRPDSGGLPVKAKPWYCTYDQEKGEFTDIEKAFENAKINLSKIKKSA